MDWRRRIIGIALVVIGLALIVLPSVADNYVLYVMTRLFVYVLVALVSFRFGHTLNVFVGFLGLVLGILAVLIEARMGTKRYFVSLAILVVFGLITAANVG